MLSFSSIPSLNLTRISQISNVQFFGELTPAKDINLDLLRDQLSWGLTYKPVQANFVYQPSVLEDKEIQASHSLVYSKKTLDKDLFTRIKTAIIRYPDNPIFMNYKFNAFIASGRKSEAEAYISVMVKRFPDYLFGKIAFAHLYK